VSGVRALGLAVQWVHVGGGVGDPVLTQVRIVRTRYARVPRSCPDCLGEPVTVPPGQFAARLLLCHDPGCPLFGRLAREAGGRS
jgi:hypothetical protein